MAAASGSMKMANKDDRKMKRCDISPFVVIVAIGDVYKILTQWIND